MKIMRCKFSLCTAALLRFLGMMRWFRDCIRKFCSIADPPFFLVKKGIHFHLTSKQEQLFQELREKFSSFIVLIQVQTLFLICSLELLNDALDSCFISSIQRKVISQTRMMHVRIQMTILSKGQGTYGQTKLQLMEMTYAVLECTSYVPFCHSFNTDGNKYEANAADKTNFRYHLDCMAGTIVFHFLFRFPVEKIMI